MAKNQTGPRGAYEPMDVARGDGVNSTPLGNKVAVTAGTGVGVGYNVHRSGGQHGLTQAQAPVVPRQGDVMSNPGEGSRRR